VGAASGALGLSVSWTEGSGSLGAATGPAACVPADAYLPAWGCADARVSVVLAVLVDVDPPSALYLLRFVVEGRSGLVLGAARTGASPPPSERNVPRLRVTGPLLRTWVKPCE